MNPIRYVLRKRFSAFLITIVVIIGLYLLKELARLESEFTLGIVNHIQIIAGVYMGSQTVSDTISALKNK